MEVRAKAGENVERLLSWRKSIIHTEPYRYGSVWMPLSSRALAIVAAPTRTPRASWIDEGLRALATGGPEAVRVEQLAESLGVTKGGFYWHFENRSALLEEILDAWERLVVDDVIEQAEAEDPDPRVKLRRVFALGSSLRDVIKVELAIRDRKSVV